MTVRDWMRETRSRLREEGLRRGVRESGYELYVGGLRRLGDLIGGGRSIFTEEWDVLVVADACRYDLMQEVVDEYDFLGSVERFPSLGSSSQEWIRGNFGEPHPETAYVTGNPFSEELVDATSVHTLDEVWRYAWNEELGTIEARPLTDRAIETWRTGDPERLVVHYMQPHYPFIEDPELHDGMVVAGFGDADTPFWQRVRHGEVSKERAWAAYRDNLRYVLDEVAFLRRRIDADRVVVTADHGNAVGEYGVYGHPSRVPLSVLRTVPWCVTDARREESYDPSTERPDTAVDADTAERLERLGYV